MVWGADSLALDEGGASAHFTISGGCAHEFAAAMCARMDGPRLPRLHSRSRLQCCFSRSPKGKPIRPWPFNNAGWVD
jgi:hypothetical protein